MPRKRHVDQIPPSESRAKTPQKPSRRSLRGKALSPVDKEVVLQTFAITGNQTKTAEIVGLSVSAVHKIVVAARTNGALAKARAHAAEELAGRVHDLSLKALDNIKPEDFKSERVYQRDADGNVTSMKEYGPSVMQKVTAFAILVDKEAAITNHIKTLREATGGGIGVPLPEDAAAALDAIKSRISRLRVLDLQFEQQAPDLAQRVAEATAAHEVVEAEIEDVPAQFPFDS
jgi:hypothetical protein